MVSIPEGGVGPGAGALQISVWHVRSAEMRLSSEELLGALDGYAATVREDVAGSWKW